VTSSVATGLVGLIVVAGWMFDVAVLKSILPGFATMKANTAISFMFASAALCVISGGREGPKAERVSKGCAGVVVLIGAVTLFQYLFGVNLGIDQLIFKDKQVASGPGAPGRMSGATAFNFILLGSALPLLERPRARWLGQSLTLFAAVISLVAIAGYAYSAEALYSAGPFHSVALHTALTFMVLSSGILLARPDSGLMGAFTDDTSGGMLARRLLPAAILIPFITEWIRLLGERAGFYGATFGIAIFAVMDIVILGTLVGWTAFLVTRSDEKRKLAEATTLQLAAAVESSDDAIITKTLDGVITSWNRGAERIFGYRAHEILGKPITLLVPPELMAEEISILNRIRKGDRVDHYETHRVRKDGSRIEISLTVSPILDAEGRIVGASKIAHDVTKLRAAEASMERAQDRLRALSDANLIGIFAADFDGRILEANAIFLKMVGYTEEDLSSGKVRWDVMTPPEYQETDRRAAEQLKSTGQMAPYEKEYIRKDGSKVPVLVGVAPMKNTAESVIAFAIDLGERKRLEEQLRQSQRMEVVGRLAGGVAHDFNNLLTPILGYSEIILSRLAPDDSLREELQEIQKAGERAAGLTRQLLAFSRKQVLQPKVVDLNGLISDASKLLRRLIGEDVTLALELAPKLRRTKVDPGQVEQVLMNLAVNARDAMPRGGKLTVETANVDLGDDYAKTHAEVTPGPHVLLAVSDTGVGMDKKTMARLFEPFFTTKEQGKGTGLGLATVHGIIKQSRGHIWVYSEVGRGTTFKIYLPEEREGVFVAEGKAPDRRSDRGTETILIVEDDESLRVFAAKALTMRGYTVLEAKHGENALLVSKTHQGGIDLLLTDVVMPGMSGREAARQLLTSRPRMKVLYMSGYTENAIVHHGVLDEGTVLLEKPFTPESLARQVRALLDVASQ